MTSLEGTVERVTFFNPENGYSVIRLKPARGDIVTLVGNLPELTPGEHLRLQGEWSAHAEYGRQFKVERCEQTLPATVEGIRRYLGSGLIKGIGPRTADRIVETFGRETLDVIDRDPDRLREVPDIGPKRYKLIREAWDTQKHIKEVMVFLQGHGLSTGLAVKIYKRYGDDSLAVVNNDPYQLARDIWGIGFRTADKIARALGLPLDAPTRWPWPRPRAARPSASPRPPAAPPRPCTGCSASRPWAALSTTSRTACPPTWWWSTRLPCSTSS